MPGPISIRIDDSEVRSHIGRLLSRLQNPKPALNEIGLYMKRSILTNFKEQGRPKKWPAVAARKRDKAAAEKRSKAGKALRGHKILIDTGNLRSSIAYDVQRRGVLIGTNVKYAPTHNFGDKARNIPQREFLMFQKNDYPAIMRILKRHVEGVR